MIKMQEIAPLTLISGTTIEKCVNIWGPSGSCLASQTSQMLATICLPIDERSMATGLDREEITCF